VDILDTLVSKVSKKRCYIKLFQTLDRKQVNRCEASFAKAGN